MLQMMIYRAKEYPQNMERHKNQPRKKAHAVRVFLKDLKFS